MLLRTISIVITWKVQGASGHPRLVDFDFSRKETFKTSVEDYLFFHQCRWRGWAILANPGTNLSWNEANPKNCLAYFTMIGMGYLATAAMNLGFTSKPFEVIVSKELYLSSDKGAFSWLELKTCFS